jgi:hypothetical protein
MILEVGRDMPEIFWYISNGGHVDDHDGNMIQRFISMHPTIKDKDMHTHLQNDLMSITGVSILNLSYASIYEFGLRCVGI